MIYHPSRSKDTHFFTSFWQEVSHHGHTEDCCLTGLLILLLSIFSPTSWTMKFFGSVSIWFDLYVHILDQQCKLVTGTMDLWIGCLFPLFNLEWKYSHYRFQYGNFMWRNLGCFCHHDRCIGGQRNSITCVGTGVNLNPLQIPWVHPTKEKKEKKRKKHPFTILFHLSEYHV